jgi:hypothetical protein
MNAKVYTGTDHYAEALPLLTKITGSAYKLHTNYNQLFFADNDKMGAKQFIFAVAFDGLRTQTYGTTFLTHAPVGGSMKAADFGINGGWGGIRTLLLC